MSELYDDIPPSREDQYVENIRPYMAGVQLVLEQLAATPVELAGLEKEVLASYYGALFLAKYHPDVVGEVKWVNARLVENPDSFLGPSARHATPSR